MFYQFGLSTREYDPYNLSHPFQVLLLIFCVWNNENDTDKLTSVSVHGKKLTHVWDVLNYLCSVNRHGFRDRYLV